MAAARRIGTALLAMAGLAAGFAAAQPVTQVYSGDVIYMAIDPYGRPEINVKPSTHSQPNDPYVRQYYCGSCGGLSLFLDGTTGDHFATGYLSGTLVTPVSNTTVPVPGGTSIVTVVNLGGTGVRLTQTFTHLAGTRYVSKSWLLENLGTATHNDLRFIFGQDTYFGDNDFAYGFFDAANSMVFIRNQNTTDWGIMGFYANSATPADHYFEGFYGTGYQLASSGQLPDSIDASYVDASYYLQWNRATLAPGASWSISATEVWTPANDLQVLAPNAQIVGSGTTATLSFTVQNLSNSALSVNLAATAGSPGWTATLNGGATRTIPANSSLPVTVSAGVPLSANGASLISLSATSGSLSSTASATLTATALNLLLNPESIDFGSQLPGSSVSQVVTLSNGGSTVTLGNLATTAPFGKSADNCSGRTLSNESSCTFTVTFSPAANGNFSAVFNIPVSAPVLATRSIALAGSANLVLPNTPAVAFDPPILFFGSQAVNTVSAPLTSVLSNNGTGNLLISSITSVGDVGFSSNCPRAPAYLPVGGVCNINVTFAPLGVGSQSASILIEDNAGSGQHGIGIRGQGIIVPQPAIGVTPNSLTFADRVIGSLSPVQSLTVTNTGNGNLNLASISINGSGYLRVAPTPADADCGAVVGPQLSCQIALVFAPGVVGVAHGSVVINHNAQGGSTSIPLSANGLPRPQALIGFSANLTFGDQIIGTVSASQAITVSNIGTAPLNISSVTVTGANSAEFTLGGNCSLTLAPGANCGLSVAFMPATVGSKLAQIAVASNAQNDVVVTPTLSGNAVPVPVPIARLSATTLGFGNAIYGGQSSAQVVTLANVGSAPLRINSIAMSGNGDFAQAGNCGNSLSASAQCSLTVTFTARALGARSGTLSISSNAAGSPHTVQLTGTGCRYFSPAAARFFLAGC